MAEGTLYDDFMSDALDANSLLHLGEDPVSKTRRRRRRKDESESPLVLPKKRDRPESPMVTMEQLLSINSKRKIGSIKRTSKGHWTKEEDSRLSEAVRRNCGRNWKRIAESVPGRTDV